MTRGTKDEDAGPTGEPNKKRRCVQSACVPCRRRKSKCDGGTPNCATCVAVYKTACHYDADSENRRSKAQAGTKRDAAVAASSSATAPTHPQATAGAATATAGATSTSTSTDTTDFLLSAIRTLPDPDLNELIHHIRTHQGDGLALQDTWRKTVPLPPSTAPLVPQSLESELSMVLGKPAMTRSGESRYFGHTSSLSLVPEDENYTPVMPRPMTKTRPPTWTAITHDLGFVERLLDLYFRWSHPFYVVFSRECFYKDFRSGRDKYCSSLLVNALLAYACHFTDEPAGRTDPDNFRTAGDHFFNEARRLLFENETSSLTTVQALCVMAMREPSAGRDSSGFAYMGRCMRMAIEMGLHLKNSAAPAMGLTPSEIEVRKVTFWGCFTVDTVWSICIGRISQLPRVAITLDKPILDEPSGLTPEAYSGASQLPPGTVTSRMFLQEFGSLSELINDNNYMFYAPSARLTDIKLINCHNKYLDWYKNLPPQLQLSGVKEPQPHIIMLHMLYHTAIGQLFRPMLKIELVNFKLKPRDACIEAANKVSELLREYRTHYPMRTCQLVLTHILLWTCIVHLTFLKDSKHAASCYRYLVEGLQALDDLSICHWFGARAFKIIYETSKAWDLGFPSELKNSKLIPKSGTVFGTSESSILLPRVNTGTLNQSSTRADYDPGHASANLTRRESLNMFARPDPKGLQLPSHPATSQQAGMLHGETQHRGSVPHVSPSYSPTSSTTPQTEVPQSHAPQNNAGSAETLFWNPLPHMAGMGAPILPRNNYPVGPMDLDNMLGSSNEWDRFGRDGFKMSETWNHDHTNPYGGNGDEAYSQVSGENSGYTNAEPHFGGGVQMGGHVSDVQHVGGQTFDANWWNGEGNLDR